MSVDRIASPLVLDVFRIVDLSALGLAVIFQLIIGLRAHCQLRHDSNTSPTLKFMFFLALFSASSNAMIYLTKNTMTLLFGDDFNEQHELYQFTVFFNVAFAFVFYLTLLATLILRLRIVFKGSVLEMTTTTKRMFSVLFVILTAMVIPCFVSLSLFFSGHQTVGEPLYFSSIPLFITTYLLISGLSVHFFSRNLSKLAESIAASRRDLSVKSKGTSLNAEQQRLLELSAKYFLLFFVVILSTVLSVVLQNIVSFALVPLFISIDFCINLLCLYLQFGFADEQYQRLCGCLGTRCTAMVSKRTERIIRRKLEKASQSIMGPGAGRAKADTIDTVSNTSGIDL